jgi:hypothetical protein
MEVKRKRLLVTGSRTWSNWRTIIEELSIFVAYNPILVHGDCPEGADLMCKLLWRHWGGEVEGHPVTREQWRRQGKKAGFIRNSMMVNLGADWCLAFIRLNSKGATMTADLAEKAGIPTRRVFDDTPLVYDHTPTPTRIEV